MQPDSPVDLNQYIVRMFDDDFVNNWSGLCLIVQPNRQADAESIVRRFQSNAANLPLYFEGYMRITWGNGIRKTYGRDLTMQDCTNPNIKLSILKVDRLADKVYETLADQESSLLEKYEQLLKIRQQFLNLKT